MDEVVTIGLDLAKNVFQVHGIAADGKEGIQAETTDMVRSSPTPLLSPSACAIG
ncbi:hypothetical protein [Azospirillum argentinense]